VLALLCAAQFMLIVDVVVVNVALPAMRRGLGIPDGQLQLAGIAYTLTFGSLLIVAGRVGDLLGRRRVFLAGLTLFTLASAMTGGAQEAWQLFAGRSLQGVGAALISPTALALLTATFPEGSGRNRALGLWAAVGSGGAIAGQLLGGVITDVFGWRWVFFVNVPVGIVTVLAVSQLVHETRGEDRPRLDLGGAATLAMGLAAASLGLSRVADHGVDTGVVVLGALALVLLRGFVLLERRHPAPLLRFELLRRPPVRSGNLVLALLAGAVASALFFVTLYLQVVLDYSPMDVGLAFAPVTLIVLLVSPTAGRLVTRFGARRLLMAGTALSTVGLLCLVTVDGRGSYATDVLPGLAIVAFGNGLAFAPTMITAMSGVRPREQGVASGLLNTSQELGTAIGLAVLASIAAAVTGASDAVAATAMTNGYRVGFACAAALAGVAFIVAIHTPRSIGKE
jgi:EmrB/QacA subfamily drug resistance transporter